MVGGMGLPVEGPGLRTPVIRLLLVGGLLPQSFKEKKETKHGCYSAVITDQLSHPRQRGQWDSLHPQ